MSWSSRNAECPSCGRRLTLNTTGKMVVHGPLDNRCPGSWGDGKPGTVHEFHEPVESARFAPVLSPPPPGVSPLRWSEVVVACRGMDERANRGASDLPPLSPALR